MLAPKQLAAEVRTYKSDFWRAMLVLIAQPGPSERH